jgi:hypothetical protein
MRVSTGFVLLRATEGIFHSYFLFVFVCVFLACKCPPVQTFKKTVSPGESKAFVTWQEPTPNCEVTLESSDSTAPDGLFTVGKYTRQYTYRHEAGFSMTCDVNIEVEGMFDYLQGLF